jgi:hypothetical protein
MVYLWSIYGLFLKYIDMVYLWSIYGLFMKYIDMVYYKHHNSLKIHTGIHIKILNVFKISLVFLLVNKKDKRYLLNKSLNNLTFDRIIVFSILYLFIIFLYNFNYIHLFYLKIS